MTTSIVPAVNEMTVIDNKVSVASYQAMQSLMAGRVPASAIKTHVGKGGQELMYASHIHGTKTMNEAFSQLWDMEVLRETVYADNSATAAVNPPDSATSWAATHPRYETTMTSAVSISTRAPYLRRKKSPMPRSTPAGRIRKV